MNKQNFIAKINELDRLLMPVVVTNFLLKTKAFKNYRDCKEYVTTYGIFTPDRKSPGGNIWLHLNQEQRDIILSFNYNKK